MRFTRLVAGIDFSTTANDAATWATRFFAPSAEVVLTHAIDLPPRARFFRSAPPADEVGAARDLATPRLEELSRSLAVRHIRSEIRVGKPSDVVLDVARETRADLVVIGPHGERPRTIKFLGTAADRIVRLSPVPVLVATQPRSSPPRHILAPVDDASITPELLACVNDLAETFDAEVTLLHVWSHAAYSHVASMSYATAKDEDEARRQIRTEVESEASRWVEELARTGVRRSRVNALVQHGNAGDVTLDMANAIGADLIVLGRHGSGLVAPALLGSTVGTVLYGARCPVLVVTGAVEAR